jgi:hypothetical protein
MPLPIASTAFVIRYLLIIVSFDAVDLNPELLKTSLHKERINKLTTVIRVSTFAVDISTYVQSNKNMYVLNILNKTLHVFGGC